MQHNTHPDSPDFPADIDSETSNAQSRSEAEEYFRFQQQRKRIFPRAALTGLLAGLMAILFRALLLGGETLRSRVLVYGHGVHRNGWIFPVLFGMIGSGLAVFLTRRFAPEASGSGIPHLEATLHRYREMNWKRILPIKLLGGSLALSSGMVLGREGPSIQMGGATGAAVADMLKSSSPERMTLIAAGSSAGLAAAFNAPLSGLVFVLEEVQRDFRPAVFGAGFIAAAVADTVARFASGQLPVFSVPTLPVSPLTALPAFAILGTVCGFFGVLFNKTLVRSLDLFARLPSRGMVPAAALVGAVVGLAAWLQPATTGSGHSVAEMAMRGGIVTTAIPMLLILRFGLGMLSYGTGAPGGIFAPLLALGALIGLGLGRLAHGAFPTAVPLPEAFAVAGMAACFASIVRAPLTGVVLITEMTGSYGQMLGLLTTCFCAYAVAEALDDLPIYERLLARDLMRGGTLVPSSEPFTIELEVQPGSNFEGKLVRDLGLPPGVLLIHCRQGSRESTPTADTCLTAHMRIAALIPHEDSDGLQMLRHGCEG